MRHVGGEPLLALQLPLEGGGHGVECAGDGRHLVLGAGGVLRPRVVHARVEVAGADPAGHPRGEVQPARDPGDGEDAHDQGRPDRQEGGAEQRTAERVDRLGALRVVEAHGEGPAVGGARRPHRRPAPRSATTVPRSPRRASARRGPGGRAGRRPRTGERLARLVQVGDLAEPDQRLLPGVVHGLPGHGHVDERAEQRGEGAAHHRDEHRGLPGERRGPGGPPERPHGVSSGGEGCGRRGGYGGGRRARAGGLVPGRPGAGSRASGSRASGSRPSGRPVVGGRVAGRPVAGGRAPEGRFPGRRPPPGRPPPAAHPAALRAASPGRSRPGWAACCPAARPRTRRCGTRTPGCRPTRPA